MKRLIFKLILLLFSLNLIAANVNQPEDCSLSALQKDKAMTDNLTFGTDPAGLVIESKNNGVEVTQLLQHYATIHHCVLYNLSMFELVRGLLLKGTLDGLPKEKIEQAPIDQADVEKKHILLDGDKAVCIHKLGLNIPVNIIEPNLRP